MTSPGVNLPRRGAPPTQLTAGTRLGPYEILGPPGAGGMGRVFRARDVKLGRAVAVKVLRDDGAHDPSGWPASTARPSPRSSCRKRHEVPACPGLPGAV